MSGRRGYRFPRRPSPDSRAAPIPIIIRVGSRASPRKYRDIQVTGARDAGRFARLIDDQVRLHPRDPLIIALNGHQPWLSDVLGSCIDADQADISALNRAVQFAGTAQFPEKANKRARRASWTFILDQMNVPQVYAWSVDIKPPATQHNGLPHTERHRLRTGVWTCGEGACRFAPSISVTLIFTQPLEAPELIVSELLFDYLHREGDVVQPRRDEEGVCWIFSRLYWLLTDWQNIIRECSLRLDEAEMNSHGRHLPVKLRTRTLHKEVARMHELQEFLHFHQRAFRKLAKNNPAVQDGEPSNPIWTDVEDAADDLEQFNFSLNSLKERFNNLIELEFNIENASQSDSARYLSMVATIFLPISFMASVFGISTLTWPAVWFFWISAPLFVASALLAVSFPAAVEWYQKRYHWVGRHRIELLPNRFTMLGDQLPDGVDVPGGQRHGRVRSKAPDPAMGKTVGENGQHSRHVHYEKDW